MRAVRTAVFTGLCLASIAAGCGGQSDSELVISSDPQLRRMAAELLPDLAARAGMELREPVRLEERSRAELVTYLESKLDDELPEEEARERVAAYALMGLVEPDLDLRAVLLALYTEQVAGFYEPDSTALFVMDDQPRAAIEGLLVHELVHAVQDQTVDLDALTDSDRGSDRATAAQAAIEGHATLVMFEYLTEQMTGAPVDLGAIPDFGAQMRPALEAMNSQFPALAQAPRIIRESLLFPYVDGAGFVQGLWRGGSRESPFGDHLPLSTEQVLRPSAGAPVEVVLDFTGGEVVLDDVMGRLELGVLLEEVVGLPGGDGGPADVVADGWDGDRYALVRRGDGGYGLVSVVVWESTSARRRFVEAAREAAEAFGGRVEVEERDVDGRPVSVLRVDGSALTVEVTLAPGGA